MKVIFVVTMIGEHHWQLEDRARGAEYPALCNLTHKSLHIKVSRVPLLMSPRTGERAGKTVEGFVFAAKVFGPSLGGVWESWRVLGN